jgi:cell division protein FtsB
MNYRYVLLALSFIVNLLLVWALVWGNNGLVAYENLANDYKVLNEHIEEIYAENLALSREIRLLQTDSKYIEQVIRKRLNFVKDNEILYVFPSDQEVQMPEGVNEPKN